MSLSTSEFLIEKLSLSKFNFCDIMRNRILITHFLIAFHSNPSRIKFKFGERPFLRQTLQNTVFLCFFAALSDPGSAGEKRFWDLEFCPYELYYFMFNQTLLKFQLEFNIFEQKGVTFSIQSKSNILTFKKSPTQDILSNRRSGPYKSENKKTQLSQQFGDF